MNEYEEDLRIDRDNLDDAWFQQPMLYMKWSDLAAEVDKTHNDLREELDVVRAKVELEVRRGTYKDMGDLKVTDKTVAAIVEADESVIAKTKEVNQARYDMNVMKGAVEAFAHRKKALEKLVDLFVFGYNSEPKDNRVDRIRELKRQRGIERERDED